MGNAQYTKSEVLAIIETYEGLAKQGSKDALERWTHWKIVLCRLEGR